MVARHGSGFYAVAQSLDRDARFLVYRDSMLLGADVAWYDPDTGGISIRILTENGVELRPVIPCHQYFGKPGEKDLIEDASLIDLGTSMRAASLGSAQRESGIPAAFTYLGQFIAHEISYATGNPAKPVSQASATLDLDSIFFGQQLPFTLDFTSIGGALGELAEDLPRKADGCPLITDDRNDDNLPLAQMHMAMMKFFNAILAHRSGDVALATEECILHFQSAVLHDYLPRIIDPCVYNDVLNYGRAIILPNDEASSALQPFYIPTEYTFACGRFGHSMIRSKYVGWNKYFIKADLNGFWNNTFSSSSPHPFHGTPTPPDFVTHLPRNWITDWRAILDFPQGGHGEGRPGATGPIMAGRIDTQLAPQLTEMPAAALPPGFPGIDNVAVRTLLRGRLLELRSGQEIADLVLGKLRAKRRPLFRPLAQQEIIDGEHPDVVGALTAPASASGRSMSEATPLWYYVLKEADKRSDGRCLGPLGSRIVMETLHAAIERSYPSIMTNGCEIAWRPTLLDGDRDTFTFSDLVSFAGLADRPT